MPAGGLERRMNERNKKEKVEEERRGGKKGEQKCRASSSGQSLEVLKAQMDGGAGTCRAKETGEQNKG